MKLISDKAKIEEILLDPYNPRFIDFDAMNQNELQKKIMKTNDAKELLNSMRLGIKWVNRIVVRRISTLSKEQKLKILGIDNYEYIIVEGNNRLACLKDEVMDETVDRNFPIPVLIAEKEDYESQIAYESELRLTQGIANVMVVKQWKPVAKARHIYRLYKDKKQLNVSDTMNKIFKNISEELGVKLSEVRTAVIRYKFYNEIAKESDTLNDNDWQYLEAIDTNQNIRSMFGMIPKSMDFEWDMNEDDIEENEKLFYKKELLNSIPEIISTVKNEGLSSKKFRDIFREIIPKYNDVEDFKNDISDILNVDTDKNWTRLEKEIINNRHNDKDIWNEKLNNILTELNNFPSPADWAYNTIDILEKIQNKIDKHLSIIKEN
ncbi:hypothetical protein CPAST_c34970 [Clostridium pasteurianum DSM 525 = ATCC 6013]|uniref:ParB/Sulfiredoxin domain-containing protein n=1 Tax=Clostridium pasteurianum DSM 525 = ATCC 6013 TaxID=1262449 RepID=A0A0H3JAH6_CLOPA|nr:hypothetical protein [Clostridium pasteurianum]AJA49558.1 hypothetical protein CPAST_c34970 [Clostridium pasteurianum DSM 525 = ATCC 6013]AJA53546.1 hypothetical protein CLPA_c34970 [Clostridium pasteurianum DSM 525 = ATCC 6013]AOZ76712.1 hypothetical protein AQ983_16980 [Clostridium pasteurianum DSM 525 = ATCC 6013]AOZ80509.1 hypothetical protein AQ984_16975 [Clostridium pasteurianum]ELP58926.1 hypothetical protein F502_12396 [Clostridium pasteurianum DSM 525 = ATCC 6013]